MSSAGNSARVRRGTVDVYLALREVAVQRCDGTLWTRTAVDPADASMQLALELERAATGGEPVTRLHIWLGASLCRPVRLPVLPGALSASELRRVGEASAIAQAGLPPPCQVWLDAPDATGRLAVVIQQQTLDTLEALGKRVHARVVSIRPLWAQVLTQALLDRPALEAMAVWEGGVLTLMAGAGEAITVARTTLQVNDAASAKAAFLRTSIAEGVSKDASFAIALDLQRAPTDPSVDNDSPCLRALPFSAWMSSLEAMA